MNLTPADLSRADRAVYAHAVAVDAQAQADVAKARAHAEVLADAADLEAELAEDRAQRAAHELWKVRVRLGL